MARKIVSVIIGVGLAHGLAVAQEQDSYVELKGALEWVAKLTERVELNSSSQSDTTNKTIPSSGETLFRTDLPAWHVTATYGWALNESIDLETDISYGRKQLNDNEFTSLLGASTRAALANAGLEEVPISNWEDADGDGNIDPGELAKGIPDMDHDYGSLMVNALYSPQLTDELQLGLGIGAGLIYVDHSRSATGMTSTGFLPGYQLKAKLKFAANATTSYLVEAGFQAGLTGDVSSARDTGVSAGDYNMTYSHFWTSAGVGYKF